MLSAEMLTGLTTAITGNITLLVPVGITVLGLVAGIKLIPKVIYTFL